jgi:hypothetical protein
MANTFPNGEANSTVNDTTRDDGKWIAPSENQLAGLIHIGFRTTMTSMNPSKIVHRVEVIDRAYAAILAAKTPAERVAIASNAHESARSMIFSRLDQIMPEAAPEERQREFLRRILGCEAN